MSDIKINLTSGDIDVSSNELLLITDSVEALKQRLYIRLQTFKEEWFLNSNAGLPYYQEIFLKSSSKDLVDSLFKSFILKTNGVLRLKNFSSTINTSTRKYSLTFTVISPEQETLTIKDFEV